MSHHTHPPGTRRFDTSRPHQNTVKAWPFGPPLLFAPSDAWLLVGGPEDGCYFSGWAPGSIEPPCSTEVWAHRFTDGAARYVCDRCLAEHGA